MLQEQVLITQLLVDRELRDLKGETDEGSGYVCVNWFLRIVLTSIFTGECVEGLTMCRSVFLGSSSEWC